MSCITANIGSKGDCLSARISRVGNALNANIGLTNEHLIATICRPGGRLKANIGIICTPNTDVYLRVTPQTLWFFKENEILDVDVISNIKWIVK